MWSFSRSSRWNGRSSSSSLCLWLVWMSMGSMLLWNPNNSNPNGMMFVEGVSLELPFQSSSFEELNAKLCVSLMTRDGRVGCSSVDSRDDMEGILLHYSYFMNNGGDSSNTIEEDQNYVVLCNDLEYTSSLVSQLQSTLGSKLQGILLVNSTALPSSSTNNDNENTSGFYHSPGVVQVGNSGYDWNGYGDGMVDLDMWGVPAALVTDSDMAAYLYKVGHSQSLPAIVSTFRGMYMGPSTINSKQCLSWQDTSDGQWNPKCQPLGGNSIWAKSTAATNNNNPTLFLTTNLDATSMFHDASTGANMAASNILTLLLAAQLVGTVTKNNNDNWQYDIAFAFFQGEQYGQMGSSRFFQDIDSFACSSDPVNAHPPHDNNNNNNNNVKACLYPLRTDLSFMELNNNIAGVLAVDQIAVSAADAKSFYVHGGNNNNNNNGVDGFLAQVLVSLSTDEYSVVTSSMEADDNGEIPMPPTAGNVVLAGYDTAFDPHALYQSHRDNVATRPIDLEAITSAATILAKAAIATAYNDNDVDTATNYANSILTTTPSEEHVQKLYHCLFTDGNCDLFLQYANMERSHHTDTTKTDLGIGTPLGTPPNYYVSVYDVNYGQPFVKVNGKNYGSYTQDQYGKTNTDTFLLRPNLLEMTIHGLLNDYLGQPPSSTDDTTTTCKSVKDCSSLSCNAACSVETKTCVCASAHYHIALDLALEPTPDDIPGRFNISQSDPGNTPMVTEPYWSSTIGVRVYRKAGPAPGLWALCAGMVAFSMGIIGSFHLKQTMKKQKLY